MFAQEVEVSTWDELTIRRLEWISQIDLEGLQPFELSASIKIVNIKTYVSCLLADAKVGPQSPRNLYGGLEREITLALGKLLIGQISKTADKPTLLKIGTRLGDEKDLLDSDTLLKIRNQYIAKLYELNQPA